MPTGEPPGITGFAVVLAPDARVMLLDEATCHLDPGVEAWAGPAFAHRGLAGVSAGLAVFGHPKHTPARVLGHSTGKSGDTRVPCQETARRDTDSRRLKGSTVALAKKGSRRIVVDGVEYRWRVRRQRLCCEYEGSTLGYVAEDVTCPGTTLVVETGRPAVLDPDMVRAEVVLPREVAAGIRAARSKGWTPSTDGSPFKLHLPAA